MPPKRGGRGGRGAAAAAQAHARHTRPDERVARPALSELPTSLHVHPHAEPVPAPIVSAFPEFTQAQPFFSALERLYPEYGGSPHAYRNCWIGVGGAEITHVERDADSDFTARIRFRDSQEVPIFVKRIHLLDPIPYMEGEYVAPTEGALPAPSTPWKHALAKLNDPLNEAYVDALFAALASRLVTTGASPHWCRCFGTFSARVETYLYNISEEYESMRAAPWWRRNIQNGLFTLFCDTDASVDTDADAGAEGAATPMDRLMAAPGDTLLDGDYLDLDGGNGLESSAISDAEDVLEDEEPALDGAPAPVQLTAPRLRLKKLQTKLSADTSSADGGSSSSHNSSVASEEPVFAKFTNFPVQVTLLERAEGTMDELLEMEDDAETATILPGTKDERWSAWLFQVIAALSVAQHYFGFVHNDLHTNNVMWSTTSDACLYYRVHKHKDTWYMRVPTFGRLMKIIDFGRASYHLPDPAGFFISDAFYPGNDASNQYNCEPFYDPKEGKRIEPNPSFDLGRLSVSLLESLYPERPAAVTPVRIMSREGPKMYTETVSGVYNMLWEWLQDDAGKNILRGPDGEERYPDFDLYCALAADVHRAVPSKQIERALFAAYRCAAKDVPAGAAVYDLYI